MNPAQAKPLILEQKHAKLDGDTINSDLCLKKRQNKRPRDSHIKTTKRNKKVERGRTSPSCKSNYAFYDYNESPMSANKRSCKTEKKKKKKKGKNREYRREKKSL